MTVNGMLIFPLLIVKVQPPTESGASVSVNPCKLLLIVADATALLHPKCNDVSIVSLTNNCATLNP